MNEAREKVAFDVFLSHNSKDKPAVRALAALLAERGLKVWLDEDQLVPGRPWQPLLEEGIRQSRTGAVLVGADGLGPWEDEEMQALLNFAVREKKPVIPVLLPGALREPDLPLFLSNRTWVDLRNGLDKEGIDKLIWGITGKKPSAQDRPRPTQGPTIAVTRLRHGADGLVGREKEVARLDTSWHDPKTHVVTIVAWGGVGKTALVVDWMAQMAADDWRRAERVFDWSFYSQGTSDTTQASSDAFVAQALEFFGDPDPKQGSPWDRGARLASLVAKRRTLLVLDGVEPLQHPPGAMAGRLKDQALEALLKGLAQRNAGLCLVTTRAPVADLDSWMGKTVTCLGARERPHDKHPSLSHLSVEAGAQLLFDAGVDKAGDAPIEADDEELKDAARAVGGHALTLQLLGRWLAKGYNGDVRGRDLVGFQKADSRTQGGHAFRMLATYEKWLGDAGKEGHRQLAVLQLLGLFDRPADADCIAALRAEPAIEGLTEPLIGLDDDDWNYTLSNLRECGLIAAHADDSATPNPQSALDAHPLVREYFGTQLREGKPKAWQAAHRRLYEHLTQSTEHQPDTLAGLGPLYQAVAHGCLAGMHQEACDKVYFDRILRGDEVYSTRKLGALGSNLAAVACFFERPFSAVAAPLSEPDQAWLLNQAAFCLRALGRLTEATEPMRAGLDMLVKDENWKQAAKSAGNLSELELTLGQIAESLEDAGHSVDYADRSGHWIVRMIIRSTLADALFQSGQADKAAELSGQAEAMQAENQRRYPLLYSLRGFRYCDLLLAPAERTVWRLLLQLRTQDSTRNTATAPCHGVQQRAAQTLKESEEYADTALLDIALDHLSLGRATLYQAILDDGSRATSHELVDRAVAGLRRAGRMDYLPRALLSRALLRFVEGDVDGCRADLDEAWQIAERGSMKLHMADVHLHRARLFHDKKSLAEARKLIDGCGYGRRREELEDAAEAAKSW